MKKYLHLFWSMFKMAWVYNMEYRLNFIMWMIVNVLWTILDLIFFNVLMGSTQIIGSWTQADTFIMIGIFRLMGVFVWGWMESSFEMLPALVNEGRLDLILTKPVDAQFYISFHRIGTSVIASFISGIMLIVTGFVMRQSVPSLFDVLLFSWTFLVSMALAYGVYFLTMTSVLFVDRLNNIAHLFEQMYDMARYPKEIYGLMFQHALTTILPLALLIGIPLHVLLGRVSVIDFLWLHIITIIFLVAGRATWQFGLRKYSSASS